MPTTSGPKNIGPSGKSSTSDFLLCSRNIKPANTGFRVTVREIEIKFGETEANVSNECVTPSCKKNFWWSPKDVKDKKRLQEPYKNVMHERRVIRGPALAGKSCYDTDPFDTAAARRRDKSLGKSQTLCKKLRNIIGTPPPVTGRLHEQIQTDKFLEEIVIHAPEISEETQTETFLEKVPTPPYIHTKVGIDVGTQIEEGELFHFDAEAQPLIEILVDGAIEQSILEVVHEEELDTLRRSADEYLLQRETELAELRRLEAEEIRLQAEKDRRLCQERITKNLDEEMQKAIVAAKLLQGNIAALLPEIINSLEPATVALRKQTLVEEIGPLLSKNMENEVHHIVDSRRILLSIVQSIVKERAIIYMDYSEPYHSQVVEIDEFEGEECLECCLCEFSDSESCESVQNNKIV